MQNKMIRTFGATLVLALIAVAAVTQIAADRDRDNVDLATTPVEPTQPTDATPPDSITLPEPFVYRLGVLAGVTTDNFWAFYGESGSVWDAYILGPTKPALYTLDPSSGAIVPELAGEDPAAEEVDGVWRVVVTLNDQMAWSDGRSITADDAAFTFETVRRLGLGGSWAESFPAEVATVAALSPHQLLIEFTERPNIRIWPHSVGMAPVMPAHVWGPRIAGLDAAALYLLDGADDVGGGRLSLASVTPELVVSVRNPGYVHGSSPDRVEYHVYSDEGDAIAALRDGAVDSVLGPSGLNDLHLAAVVPEDPIEVVASPANGIRYLGFNLERAPMSNQAFRNALALVLDREALLEGHPATHAVADSYVGRSNPPWFDSQAASVNAARYQGDLVSRVERALAGLRETGYTWNTEPSVSGDTLVPGVGLLIEGQEPAVLTILTPGDAYDPARPVYAAGIARALGWLGFDARPVETDFDTVVDLAFTPVEDGARQYDMYLLGWTLGNPALPGFYRTFFAADSPRNNTGYVSERFDEQLGLYEGAHTMDQAMEALWAMESILTEDLPYFLLYTNSITEVYRNDRVAFGLDQVLGGLQGRWGGIADVAPVGANAEATLGG